MTLIQSQWPSALRLPQQVDFGASGNIRSPSPSSSTGRLRHIEGIGKEEEDNEEDIIAAGKLQISPCWC